MKGKLLAAIVLAGAAFAAQAQVEIRLWHAMSGAAGVELERLAARFNASQSGYRVIASHRGSYDRMVAVALAGRRSEFAPHLMQVSEAGSAELTVRGDAVRPLWQVLAEAGQPLEAKYVAAVADHVSDPGGRLLALPFNTSTAVLYYNRDAFRRAGLDPGRPPKTWPEAAGMLGALVDSGERCGYTTAWPSWVLLENMSAWHDQAFATRQSGVPEVRLSFNGQLMVRWVAMLASWHKSGYFTYSGRESEAEARFAAGECAVLTSSSASYAALRERAAFDLAVAPLPYYDDFGGAPRSTLTAGDAIWVMSGRAKTDYRGVARFIGFLAAPDVQAGWHQKTGAVPLTRAAYELTRKQGFYAAHPGHEVPVRQLLANPPGKNAKPVHLGEFRRIRTIIDEELEAVWGGRKTPLDALNSAVARGNALLGRISGRLTQ